MTEYVCQQCGDPFQAKRIAKFCSTLCQNRSRKRTPPSSEQQAEWRRRRLQTPGYREKVNEQGRVRAKAVKDFLNAYKIEHGCIDCGYKDHPVALDFDHVEGEKSRNVSHAKSIDQAKQEIEKCVVRCSNCHRIRTWERLQT